MSSDNHVISGEDVCLPAHTVVDQSEDIRMARWRQAR
jgi:hypothetical protein